MALKHIPYLKITQLKQEKMKNLWESVLVIFFVRFKFKCSTIDAETFICWLRSIVKYMTQVSITLKLNQHHFLKFILAVPFLTSDTVSVV